MCLELNLSITLLNVYGPCLDRKSFWEKVAARGLMDRRNLILAGDLNLTCDVGEMWGDYAHVDPLSDFFKDFFNGFRLVDIVLDVMVPTWRNGRGGSAGISKRLDRVFVAEDLIGGVSRCKSWVDFPYLSDHAPVFLRLDRYLLPTTYPFKFNASWLSEEEVAALVSEVWKDPAFLVESDVQQRLVQKLKTLKVRLKEWAKVFNLKREERLICIEGLLKDHLQEATLEDRSRDRDTQIKLLEEERDKLLLAEEEKWCLRSRAIWIKSGDKNTKFFHAFASHRRNKNHIWEIRDERGELHSGQDAIKKEAVRYFKNFYQESDCVVINEQVDTASLYGCFVKDDEATLIDGMCTKMELWEVLKSFAKDKSLGPDGWTVEFFLYFFDLVGDDLLEVVEDSRTRGTVNKSLNATFLTLIPKVNNPKSFGDYRPIDLCNLCYKMISKIIANKINPILSRSLSKEQLGFLKGRQILDAIGTAQECLHSIKVKKSKALVLKLDLKKAYDCISWDFL
jgi:hypothetical protein